MIEVQYDGNLGNNLFQYCFGRLLAEQLGYELVAKPIVGFPRTFEKLDGRSYQADDPLTLRGQKPDLNFINDADLRQHIRLTGYFQRAEYYERHLREIRKWLELDYQIDPGIGPDDVVVGVRRGRDYIPHHGLPMSYYESALASVKYDRVYICSNEPRDPFVRYLAKTYRATVRIPGALDNLAFIKRFRKIVISNSTFLWWAAFLSDAQEIVFPRPANGFWSQVDPLSRNIDLEVHDGRYHYLACAKYRSTFLSERARNWRDESVLVAKHGLRKVFPRLSLRKPRPRPALRFTDEAEDDLPELILD